jgi:uncharacterized protein
VTRIRTPQVLLLSASFALACSRSQQTTEAVERNLAAVAPRSGTSAGTQSPANAPERPAASASMKRVVSTRPISDVTERSTVSAAESSGASARATPASQATPRCPIRLPEEPLPPAKPAAVCPKDPTGPPKLRRVELTFIDAPGAPTVNVERVSQPLERQRGLMYRTQLAANDGMLFWWPEEALRSFWMKNTCLPLDMFFIAADGTIVGILEQVPPLSLDSRGVPCPAQHVLELNAGYARKMGIQAGQRVVLR